MSLPRHETLDDALLAVLEEIWSEGHETRPRGALTRERLGVGFCLDEPRCRLVYNPERRWSLPFAVGEFCWHSAGSDRVEDIAYYSKAWTAFSQNDGRIYGSCYGRKIFTSRSGASQWDHLRRLLGHDPDSRRGVLYFDSGSIEDHSTASDVSCTASCQFFIRDKAVHCFVVMRSNDAIWGLPYDVFFFSMLQERLAQELGMRLGRYSHFATSLHVYERHFGMVQAILDTRGFQKKLMPAMERLHDLPLFLENERRIRRDGVLSRSDRLSGYWGDLEAVLLLHADRRRPKPQYREETMLSEAAEAVYGPLLRPDLSDRPGVPKGP